jgi:hypothetical protein
LHYLLVSGLSTESVFNPLAPTHGGRLGELGDTPKPSAGGLLLHFRVGVPLSRRERMKVRVTDTPHTLGRKHPAPLLRQAPQASGRRSPPAPPYDAWHGRREACPRYATPQTPSRDDSLHRLRTGSADQSRMDSSSVNITSWGRELYVGQSLTPEMSWI